MKYVIITVFSTIVLAIATKIGFFIQRIYLDIKGIALASFLSILTGMVSLGYPIIAVIASYIMFLYLLCKIGEVEPIPDAIFASIIGVGTLTLVVINNLDKFDIFY